MDSNSHHVVLFPYMSKGHIIPILQLARLLLRHRPGTTVTIFTAPANRPFIAESLSDTTANVVDLRFPENVPEIPPGVESTDKLPSMSLFIPFTRATKMMQPEFERALQALPRVSFMVSDGFLWWTLESATKFGFPRLVFFGMSCYSSSVCASVTRRQILPTIKSDNGPIAVPDFPWIKITRSDFDPMFSDPQPEGPGFELFVDQIVTMSQSHGLIVNSFFELEPFFVDYQKRTAEIKPWCVGPLCLAEPPLKVTEPDQKPTWIQWLDKKLDQGRSVLYVAFGSQAEISTEQLKEIAKGLEESKVNFLWVTRKKEAEIGQSFEERVKERGIVVRDWVDQKEILAHQSVQGFLSHCGWNSTLESICAGVPILAWPMMAEQPLNARMVSEEIKVGLRVEADDGTARGFVRSQELSRKASELMEGEMAKEARMRVKEYAELAKKAMEEGTGSSWQNLSVLFNELCTSINS